MRILVEFKVIAVVVIAIMVEGDAVEFLKRISHLTHWGRKSRV
jgi:hypothetical protein